MNVFQPKEFKFPDRLYIIQHEQTKRYKQLDKKYMTLFQNS